MAQHDRRARTQSAGFLTPPPRGPRVATEAASAGAPHNRHGDAVAWPEPPHWLDVIDKLVRPPTLALLRAVSRVARRLTLRRRSNNDL